MSEHLKKLFIPHRGNNFHPHILHRKRTVLYSFLAICVKVIVVVFALSVPAQAYLLPDILAAEAQAIATLTNATRADLALPPLKTVPLLISSADKRATDMAANQYFSHLGPKNHTLQYFLESVKYPYRVAGENLAVGFSDAESVVNAWIKSPSHYANLIDHDYTEFGIGLAAGYYQGQPTVYVAEHFGLPANNPGAKNTSAPKTWPNNGVTTVLGTKITGSPDLITIGDSSRMYWQDLDSGRATRLSVAAIIKGPVKNAVAEVHNYSIELHPLPYQTDHYRGVLTIYESSDELFKTIILPTLKITTKDNQVIPATIDWYNPKVVSATPLEKYIQAKTFLSPLTNLFSVTSTFYLVFIIFFGAALLVSVLIEFEKQHYYSIVETALMLGLVGLLWWF